MQCMLVGISKLPDTDGVDVGDVEAIDSLENVLDNSLLQLAVAAKRAQPSSTPRLYK